MYAADCCRYCARARSLLGSKGVAVEEIDVEFSIRTGGAERMQDNRRQDNHKCHGSEAKLGFGKEFGLDFRDRNWS